MTLSASLRRANQDLAARAMRSGFVQGMATGNLDLGLFQAYVAQDAAFLDAFARAYAMALATAPDRSGLGEFATLLAGVVDELRLHQGYAERWGVDPARTEAHPATAEYIEFLRGVARTGSTGAICAALTPCMRLYAHIGTELAAQTRGRGNPYREWIDTYAAPEFEALAQRLEALLDRFGDHEPAAPLYRRAMELEAAFFEAFSSGGDAESGVSAKGQVGPYINFNGRAREAMEFYRQVLGGELSLFTQDEAGRRPAQPGDRVTYGVLEAPGLRIAASDGHPGQPPVMGNNVSLVLRSTDRDWVGAAFRLLAEGGTVRGPLADQPWGARGVLVDRFGINWVVSAEKG